MQKTFKLFLLFGFLLGLLFLSLAKNVSADPAAPLNNIVISELQTGGCTAYDPIDSAKCNSEDGNLEFIELYNPLSTEVDITGWKAQYLSASGATATNLAVFDGKILPHSYVLLSHQGYLAADSDLSFGSSLAKSGGHIRIIDDSGTVIDLVGWGTASAAGVWPKTAEITAGYSIKRILPGDPLEGLGVVFTASTLPLTPQGGGYDAREPDTQEPEPGDNDTGGGQGSGPQSSCEGLIISEVLPNPAGSDSGHEFIELFNPTEDFISLSGCKLQTSANSKIFEFTSGELEPGRYKAFYNDETGLTLANSGGGTVYLIDTDDTEIYQVDYGAGLEDDLSWSLVDGSWMSTFSVTPSGANKFLEFRPCPAGQFRNPDTGRCNNIIAEAAGLSPCALGKERNPATNRCRLVASFASTLTACAPGQIRNPATNRCKKTSSGSLASCKPGQERNPLTNRCKKSASAAPAGGINDIKDVLSSSTAADKSGWFVAAGTVSASLFYAVWEWRAELFQKFGFLKPKPE